MRRLVEGGIDRFDLCKYFEASGQELLCLFIDTTMHSKGTPSTELALCLFLPINIRGLPRL